LGKSTDDVYIKEPNFRKFIIYQRLAIEIKGISKNNSSLTNFINCTLFNDSRVDLRKILIPTIKERKDKKNRKPNSS
jgi:hypothetical protein